MRRYGLWIVLVGFGLTFTQAITAAAPPADTSSSQPSAAELVQGVIDAENKILELRSLYVRFEGKWTNTPELIAQNKARIESRDPEHPVTPEKHVALWPELPKQIEIAFDQRRARYRNCERGHLDDLCVFDGTIAARRIKHFLRVEERNEIRSHRQLFTEMMFLEFTWLQCAQPTLWFMGSAGLHRFTDPQSFIHAGIENLRGRECFLLANRASMVEMLVGVDDHRLYEVRNLHFAEDADRTSANAEAAGRSFADDQEFDAWFGGLSLDARQEFEQQHMQVVHRLAVPVMTMSADEYRELAPGFWIPAVQGRHLITDPNNQASQRSQVLRLVEGRANQRLADELFALPIEQGVRVDDFRYAYHVSYQYDASRTSEELQHIFDQHRQENAEWRDAHAARDALLGTPAPALPQKFWLNSETLDWNALKGKVVLLDFWAEWCGACLDDLPRLDAIRHSLTEAGIVVIAVHAADKTPQRVAARARQLKVRWPIVIDQPGESPDSHGRIFDHLAIRAIPLSVVIDRDGKIAAHGSLHETLPKARELASRAESK